MKLLILEIFQCFFSKIIKTNTPFKISLAIEFEYGDQVSASLIHSFPLIFPLNSVEFVTCLFFLECSGMSI